MPACSTAAEPSPDVAAVPWSLRLSGEPRLHAPDGRKVLLEQRDAALLGFLAIEGTCSRTRMMALLWSDAAEPVLRNRLRQRLYSLKQRLGCEVVVGRETLSLSTAVRWAGFDAEDGGQDLLGDVDVPDLADWLAGVRERWRLQRRERLAGRAEVLEREGRLAEAIVAAEDLLLIEPLMEHAHRRLMRLHYRRGDRAAALCAFDRCERVLKDELGATPGNETLELLAQIERARPLAVAAGADAPRIVPASVLRPPRLIGRDAEWNRLQAAWDRGDAIVVVGEAGLGKTRLLGDLVRVRCEDIGSALQVAARPGDDRAPYALLGRLLRGLLALRTGALPDGVEAELARLLPELPQRELNAKQGDAAARARFQAAVEAVLKDAVDAGLQAIALDDLHFADVASLELARALVGNTGVRWLTAFRAAEIGPAAQALVDALIVARHAEPVVLQPLDAAQVGELLDTLEMAADATPSDVQALAGALHRRTGGNPLFLLETLKALLTEAGNAAPGRAQAEALSRLPASGSVGRLITRRLGQLSREAIALARCAAIAGQDFTPLLAQQVMRTPAIALADPWRELERAQVIRDGSFAHDLIHDAVLASVPGAIATHLHGLVAAYLAARSSEAARVAHHWQLGGCPERAGPAWLEAARHCARRGRRAEQVQVLERAAAAFALAGDRRGQFEALLERAQVLGQHADLAAAVAALAEAQALADLHVRDHHVEAEHRLAPVLADLDLAHLSGTPAVKSR